MSAIIKLCFVMFSISLLSECGRGEIHRPVKQGGQQLGHQHGQQPALGMLGFLLSRRQSLKPKPQKPNEQQLQVNYFQRYHTYSEGYVINMVGLAPSRGPERNDSYWPHHAFETYWQDGQWVYTPYTPKGTALICNKERCLDIYKRYGVICAIDNKGIEQTFENYCEMMKTDCLRLKNWQIARQGNCTFRLSTHPWDHLKIIKELDVHLKSYATRLAIAQKRFTQEHLKSGRMTTEFVG